MYSGIPGNLKNVFTEIGIAFQAFECTNAGPQSQCHRVAHVILSAGIGMAWTRRTWAEVRKAGGGQPATGNAPHRTYVLPC